MYLFEISNELGVAKLLRPLIAALPVSFFLMREWGSKYHQANKKTILLPGSAGLSPQQMGYYSNQTLVQFLSYLAALKGDGERRRPGPGGGATGHGRALGRESRFGDCYGRIRRCFYTFPEWIFIAESETLEQPKGKSHFKNEAPGCLLCVFSSPKAVEKEIQRFIHLYGGLWL